MMLHDTEVMGKSTTDLVRS
ncbi:hypothetical protein L345_15104 [Ophiophagus hannah]|uniref:Uncharacterized protein n=1 Tax=Ophiophagus hannah TaxID=8665 RepID=V8NA68_OPHHA|nr:hypothetical protein L345_15104 [Ophiophagus hannah]